MAPGWWRLVLHPLPSQSEPQRLKPVPKSSPGLAGSEAPCDRGAALQLERSTETERLHFPVRQETLHQVGNVCTAMKILDTQG